MKQNTSLTDHLLAVISVTNHSFDKCHFCEITKPLLKEDLLQKLKPALWSLENLGLGENAYGQASLFNCI